MSPTKSSYYQDLERSVGKTCSCFRPSKILLPSHCDYVRAAALHVLCHAEIETYFELSASIISSAALDAFKTKKIGTRSHREAVRIVSSLIYYYSTKCNAPTPQELTDDIAKQFVGKHKQTIKDNNGIKEGNLHNLFSPLGLDISVFDTVGVATLNTFGKSRGAIAHNKLTMSTQHVLVPGDVKENIKKLLVIVKNMDAIIFNIMP